MRKLLFLFLFTVISAVVFAKNIKVLVVTGGHAYDTIQFNQLMESFDEVECTFWVQPQANKKIAAGDAKNFDVLVFYDMWKEISGIEKSAYLHLTQLGVPFLFLHHSLASYQKWPDFRKIIGGKYVEKAENVDTANQSDYEHDVWVYGRVLKNHPVTAGFSEFRFFDEIYINVKINNDVIPLIKTTHPKSMPYIAWENHFNNSKIIYLQSGHDYRTYEEPDYRRLVYQAIKYLANSNKLK